MATPTLPTPIKALLLAGAAYLGYQAYQKKLLPIQPAETDPVDPSSASHPTKVYTPKLVPPAKPVPLSDFPLKKGSRGEYVKTLQRHLAVAADGIFGPATEAALYRRYGKKQIMTLGELTVMIQTGTTVPLQPATKPSVPKPSAGTPSGSLSEYQKKLLSQMGTVFNAIWSQTGGSKVYSQKMFGDWESILPILKGMTDQDLKGFANAYARSFKNLQFAPSDHRKGTLVDDLNRVTKNRANVAYFAQIDRLKKLGK